jgi:hypothetical protein
MSAARQRDDLGVAPFARFPSRPESASGASRTTSGATASWLRRAPARAIVSLPDLPAAPAGDPAEPVRRFAQVIDAFRPRE